MDLGEPKINNNGFLSSINDRSYPCTLQSLLGPDFKVINYGVGGTTVQNQSDSPYTKQ